MNADNLTPDDAMGDNFERSEMQIAKGARDLIRRYDRLLDRHDKVLGEIHETIIAFGRLLLAAREMYGSGLELGRWVQRRRLDTSRISQHQTERTACMSIAQLHDTGPDYDDDEEDDGSRTPARLDLTDCKLTTPTNIMKWARKHQPHLFPHVRPRNATPVVRKPKRENEAPLDRILNDHPNDSAATLDEAIAIVTDAMRKMPKEARMREISRIISAVDLNIHDWVSTMTIGKT